MDPASITVVLALIERGAAAFAALQAVSDKAKEAKAKGVPLTLDDLKELELDDDAAHDELVKAISEAE